MDKKEPLQPNEIFNSAIEKCKELIWEISGEEDPTEATKRDVRLTALGELSRWKQDKIEEERIFSTIYPDEDPKIYYQTLEYLLRHFETIYEATIKTWVFNNPDLAKTRKEVLSEIENTIN